MLIFVFIAFLLSACGFLFYLVFANERYIRVKAIIAMGMGGFGGPPAISAVSKWFQLSIDAAGISTGAISLALVGMVILGYLEVRATKQLIFGETLDALVGYQRLLAEGASPKERLKYVKKLRANPDVDRSITDIILAAELGDQGIDLGEQDG